MTTFEKLKRYCRNNEILLILNAGKVNPEDWEDTNGCALILRNRFDKLQKWIYLAERLEKEPDLQVAVLAHEIGHHICQHPVENENINNSMEVSASLAGLKLLKKFNASKDEIYFLQDILLQDSLAHRLQYNT